MRSAVCAYCHRVVQVLDAEWGKQVRCDKLRCLQFFKADRAPSGTEPLPAIPAAVLPPQRRAERIVATLQFRGTQLTGPYHCPSCGGETHQPMGFRRRTVLHRMANTDADGGQCKMSTYAAIYFCPNQGCHALLETPSDQWEQHIQCPACAHGFLAPRDDVLHEKAGDHREGVPFQFRCPSCWGLLQCDSTRNGQPMRGQRVVCLHCDQIIEVPSGSETRTVAR